MFDLLIKNARIIDGTGAPWYRGNIAVKDGKITNNRQLTAEDAVEVFDAGDNYVCPGFVDIHSHSDDSILAHQLAESRIFQGVTTEIGENCGTSPAPVNPEYAHLLKRYIGGINIEWQSVKEYLNHVEKGKISVNFGLLVGHGTIRVAVMGFSADKATPAQISQMRDYAAKAMEDGAFGLSSGLIYPPGSYADTDELAEVASAVAPYGGLYATHMRNESADVTGSVKESLDTAMRAGVPLQISHHKVTHRPDWRVSCKTTVAMIARARREGFDVTCDQYPYNASSTSLTSNVPHWAFEGGLDALIGRLKDPKTRTVLRDQANNSHIGRWDCIYVSHLFGEKNQWMIGKNVVEIAKAQGKDTADAVFDIIIEENGEVGEVNFGMCDEDIEYIMSQPFTMIGSDGRAIPLSEGGKPHPRNFGTFPRVISHFCRERKLFPLETAIAKMTSMPAARLGLLDRGAIKDGMWADLVVFDFDAIKDTPTYERPQQQCEGILRVYVNGRLTAENGRHTGALAGKVLRW